MLYEVITPKGYSSHPSKKLPVVYYLPGQPAGAEGLFNAEPFEVLKMIAGLQQGADFPEEGFRITSYNVCYTKLLRLAIRLILHRCVPRSL